MSLIQIKNRWTDAVLFEGDFATIRLCVEAARESGANLGGADFLASMYDRLVAAIAQRPATIVVRSKPGQVEATYAAIAQALSPRDVP